MSIIAFCGQKGGAGKSTLSIATASELTRRGYDVLLVDADEQGTASDWGVVATSTGEPTPAVVAMRDQLAHHLPDLARKHHVTVVDCPGRNDDRQRMALSIAALAIVPLIPSSADAWAMRGSLEVIRQAKTFRPELAAMVVINQMEANTAEGAGARDTAAQTALPVFDTTIGKRVDFKRMLEMGTGVVQYNARSKASNEIQAFVDEVVKALQSMEV